MTGEKLRTGSRRVTGRMRERDRQRNPAAACAPMIGALEAQPAPADPEPIWFAALVANCCRATKNGEDRSVQFEYVSGRALYTNCSAAAEKIDLLGVSLLGGQTLVVYWAPGETEYTLEVYEDEPACA